MCIEGENQIIKKIIKGEKILIKCEMCGEETPTGEHVVTLVNLKIPGEKSLCSKCGEIFSKTNVKYQMRKYKLTSIYYWIYNHTWRNVLVLMDKLKSKRKVKKT